jgi:RsiW-degrading membrane proteinase PrsW (M82 family)
MEIILLIALAIAPCAALILFIYFRDKYEREPWKLLLVSFLLGVLSIAPAMVQELLFQKVSFINDHVFVSAFFGVAFVEEFWKLFFLLLIPYRRKSFNEPFDGIVYAVMVSMGFAMLENILYVVKGGWGVGVLRIFTAVPAHAMFAVVMGYFVGLAKFTKGSKTGYILLGFTLAFIFHGIYDYCLFEQNYQGMWIGALLSLIVGLILSLRAIKLHRKRSLLLIEEQQKAMQAQADANLNSNQPPNM